MAKPEYPEFIVRLVMRVTALNLEDAVPAFVDTLVERGMRNWLYRVEDPDTGEVLGFFDGNGSPVELDPTLLEEAETERERRDAEEANQPIQQPVQQVKLPAEDQGESDSQLLAVAEQANAEGS